MNRSISGPLPARRVYESRRKRRWWKMFASPLWLLLAAPALLLPLAAIILLDDEPLPSMVDQAIGALPLPGGVVATTASPLGKASPRLPLGLSLSLYNNSAQADAMRQSKDDSSGGSDYFTKEFAALHPTVLTRDDLLVSDLGFIYSTPLNIDFGVIIFQQFCSSRPGDPFYGVDLNAMPLSLTMRTALAASVSTKGTFALCGSFGR